MDRPSSTPPDDALSAPLGQQPARARRRIPRAVPVAIALLLGGALTFFAGWVAIVDDPLGGEPVAIVSAHAERPHDAAGRGASPPAGPQQAEQDAAPSGAKTVTIIDGTSGARQQVVVSQPGGGNPQPSARPAAPGAQGQPASAEPRKADASPAPSRPRMLDERLIEKSQHGLLPQIAADGARPSTVYAHPQSSALAAADGPKVAIVVGKLGIGVQATAEALSKLPATVTLAFNPHASDLARLIGSARGEGREILLQIPMEPFDYPANDPGPRTLLTSLPLSQNIDRLQWAMARTTGYVGLTNYMGARLAGHEAAMTVVMLEAGKRGLAYFEDGNVKSPAARLAASRSVPFARADVLIDASPSAADIDASLARLEAIARERGVAVGSATAAPLSIARIAEWARAAESRGITLVPITAAMTKPPSS
jgi:uncharacterized protein